ncbi:hypothetical protein HQ545_04180 [Candidatus Woesearchaeota archaeon]|nr:hypothetical protein [Candidatus Woesearchaeota archaeon]
MVEYIEGVLKIANIVFSLLAGIIAIFLFRASKKYEYGSWKLLMFALLLFAVQQILGALRAFSIFSSPYLTHIVPTLILVILIIAILHQIQLNKAGSKCH